MALFEQFDYTKLPKYKVELHIHLDGAIRVTTMWELAQKKGIKLPAETLEDLYDLCRVTCPSTLEHFLKPFSTCIIPVVAGDPEAIERISFEFCQDIAKQKVLYCEVRYCPHLFTGIMKKDPNLKPLKPEDVVMSVNRGLSRGSATFQVTVRSILCCFIGRPEWSDEILQLCEKFKDQGVVGIDLAGDEAMQFASPTDISIFERAFKQGIHRTVHAGEAGPASNVKVAINDMFADRIGHGYHVVDDGDIYQEAKKKGVHFEACPYSSYFTGSVALGCPKHPIVRFAEDKVSFSINRDDPTIIQKTIDEEYELLRTLGLKDVHIVRANFNAAMHSFLPEDEKKILLKQLREVYGVSTDDVGKNKISYIPVKAWAGSGDK